LRVYQSEDIEGLDDLVILDDVKALALPLVRCFGKSAERSSRNKTFFCSLFREIRGAEFPKQNFFLTYPLLNIIPVVIKYENKF
jgi:hypothetical protein